MAGPIQGVGSYTSAIGYDCQYCELSTNYPGSRQMHTLSIDRTVNNALYIFGGWGHTIDSTQGVLNDVW